MFAEKLKAAEMVQRFVEVVLNPKISLNSDLITLANRKRKNSKLKNFSVEFDSADFSSI